MTNQIKFLNDYDQFEVGEALYLVKEVELYVEANDGEKPVIFNEDTEMVIDSISKESGYGYAVVTIEGYKTKLGLDEIYDIVFD